MSEAKFFWRNHSAHAVNESRNWPLPCATQGWKRKDLSWECTQSDHSDTDLCKSLSASLFLSFQGSLLSCLWAPCYQGYRDLEERAESCPEARGAKMFSEMGHFSEFWDIRDLYRCEFSFSLLQWDYSHMRRLLSSEPPLGFIKWTFSPQWAPQRR